MTLTTLNIPRNLDSAIHLLQLNVLQEPMVDMVLTKALAKDHRTTIHGVILLQHPRPLPPSLISLISRSGMVPSSIQDQIERYHEILPRILPNIRAILPQRPRLLPPNPGSRIFRNGMVPTSTQDPIQDRQTKTYRNTLSRILPNILHTRLYLPILPRRSNEDAGDLIRILMLEHLIPTKLDIPMSTLLNIKHRIFPLVRKSESDMWSVIGWFTLLYFLAYACSGSPRVGMSILQHVIIGVLNVLLHAGIYLLPTRLGLTRLGHIPYVMITL